MGDGSGEDMEPSEETRGAIIRKKRRGKEGRCGDRHLLIVAGHGKEGADWMSWFPEDRT